jgi:hypothetical protein
VKGSFEHTCHNRWLVIDFGGGAGNFGADDTHSYYLTARGSLGINIVYAAADISYGNL